MGNDLSVKNQDFNNLSKIADEMFEKDYLPNKIIECYGEKKANGQMIAWGNVFSNIATQYIDKDKKQTLGQAIEKSSRLKRQFIEEISKLMDKGVEMDSRNFYCAPHDLGKPNEKLEINFMVGYKKDILHKMGVYIVNMGVVYDGDEYEIRQNDKGQQYPYHNCKNIQIVMQTNKNTIGSLLPKIQFGYVCYKYREEQRILTIPAEQIRISLKKTSEDKSFSIKLNALGVYGAIEVILWKKLFNEIIYGDIAYNYEFEKNTEQSQQKSSKLASLCQKQFDTNKEQNEPKEAEKVVEEVKPQNIFNTIKDYIINKVDSNEKVIQVRTKIDNNNELTADEKKELLAMVDEKENRISSLAFSNG